MGLGSSSPEPEPEPAPPSARDRALVMAQRTAEARRDAIDCSDGTGSARDRCEREVATETTRITGVIVSRCGSASALRRNRDYCNTMGYEETEGQMPTPTITRRQRRAADAARRARVQAEMDRIEREASAQDVEHCSRGGNEAACRRGTRQRMRRLRREFRRKCSTEREYRRNQHRCAEIESNGS